MGAFYNTGRERSVALRPRRPHSNTYRQSQEKPLVYGGGDGEQQSVPNPNDINAMNENPESLLALGQNTMADLGEWWVIGYRGSGGGGSTGSGSVHDVKSPFGPGGVWLPGAFDGILSEIEIPPLAEGQFATAEEAAAACLGQLMTSGCNDPATAIMASKEDIRKDKETGYWVIGSCECPPLTLEEEAEQRDCIDILAEAQSGVPHLVSGACTCENVEYCSGLPMGMLYSDGLAAVCPEGSLTVNGYPCT